MTSNFVEYHTPQEYRRHFERVYCRGGVTTYGGIHVFFRKNRFDHAFYESSSGDGRKDNFSWERARRIDWIKDTLESPLSDWKAGWNNKEKQIEHTSSVAILVADFVVIIRFSFRGGELRGDFRTAYVADKNIRKIRANPEWDWEQCLLELGIQT